jgi:malate synthase
MMKLKRSAIWSEAKLTRMGHYVQAICIFNKLVVQDKWEDFLTLSAYDHLLITR